MERKFGLRLGASHEKQAIRTVLGFPRTVWHIRYRLRGTAEAETDILHPSPSDPLPSHSELATSGGKRTFSDPVTPGSTRGPASSPFDQGSWTPAQGRGDDKIQCPHMGRLPTGSFLDQIPKPPDGEKGGPSLSAHSQSAGDRHAPLICDRSRSNLISVLKAKRTARRGPTSQYHRWLAPFRRCRPPPGGSRDRRRSSPCYYRRRRSGRCLAPRPPHRSPAAQPGIHGSCGWPRHEAPKNGDNLVRICVRQSPCPRIQNWQRLVDSTRAGFGDALSGSRRSAMAF